MSAGKVAVVKTEQSMVVGRLTAFAGAAPAVKTVQPMATGKMATFAGRVPVVKTEATTSVGKAPPTVCRRQIHFRHRSSRSALPITTKSDTPIAAAQKIGLMNPIAASGTPSTL